nr:MAG TPA: hypothetical protein [Caudoviricetes sp.]
MHLIKYILIFALRLRNKVKQLKHKDYEHF